MSPKRQARHPEAGLAPEEHRASISPQQQVTSVCYPNPTPKLSFFPRDLIYSPSRIALTGSPRAARANSSCRSQVRLRRRCGCPEARLPASLRRPPPDARSCNLRHSAFNTASQ